MYNETGIASIRLVFPDVKGEKPYFVWTPNDEINNVCRIIWLSQPFSYQNTLTFFKISNMSIKKLEDIIALINIH